MTLFEYLAIAFSLVLSSAAMRLIRGLSLALARERRYWLHVAFVINQIGVTLGVFWVFWSLRDVAWTFPAFVLALASPGLVYAGACALVPEDPSTVLSWRTHYFSRRVNYFSCIASWAIIAALGASVLLRMPWSHPARVVQAFALIAGLVGVASDRERVHVCLAVLFLSALGIATLTVMAQPGSLAP